MHNFLRIFIVTAALFMSLSFDVSGQIRVMSYNILNFPGGSIPDRIDTLTKILDYHRPHLLMVQELKSEVGLQSITDALNTLGYGSFTHANYVSQQSAPGSSNPLQQSIVFDQNKLRLKSQNEIITSVRDINEYILYLNDLELPNGADTTFIYTYVTHLKSSSGGENEQLRLSMVNEWVDYIEANLETESNVIIAGDFNIYSNQEPAYTALMSGQNQVQMSDVFTSYGNWNSSNFGHKEILTQSTRFNQLANDGAGGGVDDRFDFILFSEQMMNIGNTIYMEEDSYKSLGNNGTCYNNSITACSTGNVVPNSILQAIYYMSDHLPQVCTLNTSIALAVDEIKSDFTNISIRYKTNGISAWIHSENVDNAAYTIRDCNGRIIKNKNILLNQGTSELELPVDQLSSGLYFLEINKSSGSKSVQRFIVNP